MSLASRLYRGETSFDIVGKRRRWYALSGFLVFLSLLSLFVLRGLNTGIDFKGGNVYEFTSATMSADKAQEVVQKVGIKGDARATKVGKETLRVETRPQDAPTSTKIVAAIANEGVDQASINSREIGARWGSEITKKAVKALVVFLFLVAGYIALRFEWRMAIAALIALVHDLVITAGIYSLVGFEVTPATVIALLTILGYSLYDTVVVYDKVRENAIGLSGGSKMTYSDSANLAVNQTLMRSINTTLTALLPVGAILFVGAGLLGAGTLKDLSLALFIGLATGAYSSIFVATPLVAEMKEREPQYKALRQRVLVRRARESGAPIPAAAKTTRAAAAGKFADKRGDGEDDTEYDAVAATATTTRPTPSRTPPRPAKPKNKGGRPSGKKRR
jgi:preprotein translocase subunit SecF